jgi:hypothetical protein
VHRPLKLILAVTCLTAAPVSAFAQTWPVSVVAAAPKMATATAQPRAPARAERTPNSLRRVNLAPPRTSVALRLSAAEDVPEVDIRPKGEWSDDQGLRVSPTRVAFKQRF